ncbi:MAG: glycosyltransferase family 2 protein [Bacteroidota bacterium]
MITVIIPCYRVKNQILNVLEKIGPEVQKIYVVDDCCPEGSGKLVMEKSKDPRVEVLFHKSNLGVGGSMKTGYSRALEDCAEIMVKIDGDGQMDPVHIPRFIEPLKNLQADYVKGNRFYDLSGLTGMPGMRRFGNSILSFVNKMVSGYWNIMDPTNGFTAISASALKHLPLDKIDNRYFFEQDMLFRLNSVRAVVVDMPMNAAYNQENSSLKIWKVFFGFPFKYLKRILKRIFYSYFLRDFNIGSLELVLAFLFTSFGVIFGTIKWAHSILSNQPATAGTVILAGLPIILGFQSFLAFLHFDLMNIPQKPLGSFEI